MGEILTGRKGVKDVPVYSSVAGEECEESQQPLTAPWKAPRGPFHPTLSAAWI